MPIHRGARPRVRNLDYDLGTPEKERCGTRQPSLEEVQHIEQQMSPPAPKRRSGRPTRFQSGFT